MIFDFDENKINEKMGNKAMGLIFLKSHDFCVPNGFVLDSDCFEEIIGFNAIGDDIGQALDELNKESNYNQIKDVSRKILDLFSSIILTDDIVCKVNSFIKTNKKYAIRSSGIKEDLEDYSFAGMYDTYLDIQGKEDVLEAIIKCYKSLFSVNVLTYLVDNDISFDNLKMAIVVQEMVESELSGVVFTVNPLTGKDTEMVADVISGVGQEYVSGKIVAETYYYNWYKDKYKINSDNMLLNDKMMNKLFKTCLDIQVAYGKPCDIEYAIKDDNIYFLQAREITRINYASLDRVWTIANFKDGGISSETCCRFMYSLYEFVWQYIMKKYLVDARLVKKTQLPKRMINMYFGRVYWDLTTVKNGVSTVPGYVEREFDSEYSIRKNYEGDGKTTGYSINSLWKGIRILYAQNKIVKNHNNNIKAHYDKCISIYNEYREGINNSKNIDELQGCWLKLVREHYLNSESIYFLQVYINTIEQSIHKNYFLKYINEMDYLTLLGGIRNISHMRLFEELWDISRIIRADKDEYDYWKNNDVATIINRLNSERDYMPKIREFIEMYGYHSNREIDVKYPCYFEDMSEIIKAIKDNILLEDDYAPDGVEHNPRKIYEQKLEEVKKRLPKVEYERFNNKLEKMRKMLWWREELKDISTRFYYLIRVYTLELAKFYVDRGYLDKTEDIWHLRIDDIEKMINGEIMVEEVRQIIDKNRKYYQSFSNYNNESEIGGNMVDFVKKNKKDILYGVGCNSGVITARARVINGIEEMDRLENNDILVTKYTDTGWTPKFAKLGGIITESGGILCHAAIVSREYGLPCIVCAYDAMNKIKDGDIITMDGNTGQIIKEK